mmetsp:Transcript_31664/g.78900  ORF Transcript_31664/g.78900 Transcript_31664/m.78900 type:complete len:149 (+) Transcript_31664:29-475(+)
MCLVFNLGIHLFCRMLSEIMCRSNWQDDVKPNPPECLHCIYRKSGNRTVGLDTHSLRPSQRIWFPKRWYCLSQNKHQKDESESHLHAQEVVADRQHPRAQIGCEQLNEWQSAVSSRLRWMKKSRRDTILHLSVAQFSTAGREARKSTL